MDFYESSSVIVYFCGEVKQRIMKKRIVMALLLGAIYITASAQYEAIGLRLTDLEKNRSDLVEYGTSSATKDNDFPVYVYGEKQALLFKDVYMILVRYDLEASNPDVYITIEVIDLKENSTLYEAAKYMRLSGKKEGEPFSIKLNKLNSIEVLRKAW